MAYVLRATYTQENVFGTTDLLEIYEDGYSGTVLELEGRFPCAFDFEHRESTSTQRDYLSIFENQIIEGVLDLYAWIDTTAKETLITDIADGTPKQFKLLWKRDSSVVWNGYPHGRIIEYNDRPQYNVKVQFRDFEILKGEIYEFDDTRQKIEATYRSLVSNILLLSSNEPLRTATSWQCKDTTVSDDFLNQVYHDTFALRDYPGNGYGSSQKITDYEALLRSLDPMIIMYQWKGINAYQISALKDPLSVQVATYNTLSQQTLTTEDLRQTIYTSADNGTPSAKVVTNNTSYPALRRAFYEFKHRSEESAFEFDTVEGSFNNQVDFDSSDYYILTQEFTGDGDENINFTGVYQSLVEDDPATFVIRADKYALDEDYEFRDVFNHSGTGHTVSSVDTSNDRLNIFADPYEIGDPVMIDSTGTLPTGLDNTTVYYVTLTDPSSDWIQISDEPGGTAITFSDTGSGSITVRIIKVEKETNEVNITAYRNILSFTSGDIPSITNSEVELVLILDDTSFDSWYNMRVFIENPTQFGQSIEYRLTQANDYPDDFQLNDSYFGDGPYSYSKSSYRTSISLNDITSGWRRRGDTTYIDYSRLKLNEVLEYQQIRQLKKTFQLWGEFDPTKVSVYDGANYMYVGGKYNGRWSPVCVRIEERSDG